jgi:hypothetical protein
VKGDFDIKRGTDGTWEGTLDLLPAVGEMNHLYHDFEKVLPKALRGFDGVYLSADGIRVKGSRGGIPFDVSVSVKAESG